MNRKSQKPALVDSFSGALSATATETDPGDGQSHYFPEHCRPHSKVNIFVYSHVRSIVGHLEVELRNFAFKDLEIIKSKDIWQEPSLT